MLLTGALLALTTLAACWYGGSHSPVIAFALILERCVYGSGPAVLYLLGAIGLGRVLRPLFSGSRSALALQAASGLALLLWLSHLLAWRGLLSGDTGRWIALALPGAGVLLGAHQFYLYIRGGGWEPSLPPLAPLLALPAGIMLAAALFAPGWLWQSEFGGYDALSYHLQLPKEWLALGRLVPLKHNVYSYLPSGVEAAFMHIASMPFPGSAPGNLVTDEGYRVYGCQILVGLVALLSAWQCAGAAQAIADRAGVQARVGSIAGGLALATPWLVVTGSMAYNDVFVVFFLAAALAASADAGLSPLRQGVLSGLLVGAACIAKPTAILFVAVPIGLSLGVWNPPRRWLLLACAIIPVGLVMLAPALARDWLDSGNPVFPFAAGWFPNAAGGTGHWTHEQVARYAASHSFQGSWVDRLRLMILPDANDPAGSRHRGLLHAQWGAFFPLTGVCLVLGLLRRHTHRVAALLGGILLVQLALWVSLTHIQSRFLLPLIVPGAALCAIVLASLSPSSRPWLARAMGIGTVAVQATFTVLIYLGQHSGHPAAAFLNGIETQTGADFKWTRRARTEEETRADLIASPPPRFANSILPPTSTLYLLGDATPFYYSAFPVLYNTTYDQWLFGEIAAGGGDPDDWTKALRAKGITHVLISFPEIDRLTRSGFIDPRVKLADVERWARAATVPIRDWPYGSLLVMLPDRSTTPKERP